MRKITKIIIHCAATPEGKDFTVQQIDQWHRQRGFRCIGYHFVIYRDGSIHKGRPIEQAGAHTSGHNAHSIGICLIGGCAAAFRLRLPFIGALPTGLAEHFASANENVLRAVWIGFDPAIMHNFREGFEGIVIHE